MKIIIAILYRYVDNDTKNEEVEKDLIRQLLFTLSRLKIKNIVLNIIDCIRESFFSDKK